MWLVISYHFYQPVSGFFNIVNVVSLFLPRCLSVLLFLKQMRKNLRRKIKCKMLIWSEA